MTAFSARAILASIVLAATLLAGLWAFLMPMMQEPDESAHIDYAFSLLTARRISLAGESISTDVHPYTRYLESATRFRGMRYSTFGRVPEGYGTRAFYAHVDADAPHVTPASTGTRPLPLYARAYPFGFYALEAIVMASSALVRPSSVVTQFFAARLFCVALLVPTLLCSYGIFRYMHLSRGLALTLTASIAFFPLTSSTFSYVQPDDLVAALIAAILLAGLHLRDKPTVCRAATVGVLLGGLALTKYHDALVLFAVVAFMALSTKRVRAKLAYVIAPPLVAFALAAVTMWFTPTTQRLLCGALGAPFHESFKAGLRALAPYVASTGSKFFSATFMGGWPFVEYWDAVGWIPHRFVIITQPVTDAVLALLCFLTVAVLIVFLMRTGNVIARLVSLGRARGAGAFARILSRDIVLNAYIAYFGFMLVANIYSANFLQHGRYWLPFMFGAVLCAVRYVPHFASRRYERPMATVVAASLAAYAAVTAVPALAIVDASYYVPRAPIPYVEAFAMFDRSTIERFAHGPVPLGRALVVSGYAVDGPSEAVARGASLLLDGKTRISLTYGALREDVVCTFNDVSLARSGFDGTFRTAGLAPGRHSIELQVGESEFARPVSTTNRISFLVGSRAAPQVSSDYLTRPI